MISAQCDRMFFGFSGFGFFAARRNRLATKSGPNLGRPMRDSRVVAVEHQETTHPVRESCITTVGQTQKATADEKKKAGGGGGTETFVPTRPTGKEEKKKKGASSKTRRVKKKMGWR